MRVSLIRRSWATFSAYLIGSYASVCNRFRIIGDEHIPASGAVLLASNHISAYETVFIPWAVMRHHPLRMVWAPAKQELFQNRFVGWLLGSWGAFPVNRGRDVKAARAINELLTDQVVMLFPEGTRNRDGQLGAGNRGVGKIIYDTRPPVVPVALAGLNRWRFPGFGQPASITFGAPLDFSDLFARPDCKETHQLIVDRVMAAIAALLATVEEQ